VTSGLSSRTGVRGRSRLIADFALARRFEPLNRARPYGGFWTLR
jgi:hypothetical protein